MGKDDTKAVGVTGKIEVTPEMIEAGLEELYEHHYGDDFRLMLEHIYRAMAYVSLEASSTKFTK